MSVIINSNGVIRQVIDVKGHKHQTIVAIEELSELQKELCKALRGRDNHREILEETADAMICLIQIREMYNIRDDELQKEINEKLQRLEERLKNAGSDGHIR